MVRKYFFIISWIVVLSSCIPVKNSSLRSRASSNNNASSNLNVAIGEGKILSENPIILTNNPDLEATYNLNQLLSVAPITYNSFLKGSTSCFGLDYCFEIRVNQNAASPLQTTDGKWAFDAYSPEFLQVNTFYHLNKIFDMFYANVNTSIHSRAYNSSLVKQYNTALPLMLTTSNLTVFQNPLIAYADCDDPNNAHFDHANMTLCFGSASNFPQVKLAQDSSIIYHEAGHFFQKMQLNFRNKTGLKTSDMGNLSYDEAGSIGEGLSDYYSYYITQRTHFGEWGVGRFFNSSRPITEDDPLHAAGISSDPDQRLSYPQFIGYDPNNPTVPVEDVHYSGMIVSHYLVALTEDIMSKCAMTKRDTSDLIIHLLSETLAEHGDLTSLGIEGATAGRINLNAEKSFEWFTKINPINYRSFIQTFAKNLLNNLSLPSLNRCNGGIYSTDQIESLLDQYGLLLFRNYNENRNLSNPAIAALKNTEVNAVNRKKSVLISKDLLSMDPSTGMNSSYIVIDNRAIMLDNIANLQSTGTIGSLSTQTPSDLGFNNENGRVSPGEVVALFLNLYNNSNSPMAGIQVLANDWNHADPTTGSPYQFPASMSNDQWPLISEGGVLFDPNPPSSMTIQATSPALDPLKYFSPVCFMQSNEANATKWVSQKYFKTKMALDSSFCLNPSNDKDCFIRAIKGADQAYFSKLDPKSTWSETLADPTSGDPPIKSSGNVLFFEISKHIPPGTIVDCRLRARFTNCDDCYHDKKNSDITKRNYDYTDTDYNGPRPFTIIHVQMAIID